MVSTTAPISGSQDAEDDRGDATKCQPPAAVIEIEAERGAEHQRPRHDGPDGDHPDQGDKCDGRPQNGYGTCGEIDHAFNNEQTPALAVACGLDTGEDGENAVDEIRLPAVDRVTRMSGAGLR